MRHSMEDSPLVGRALGVVPSIIQLCDILTCNEDTVMMILIDHWMVSGVEKGLMKSLWLDDSSCSPPWMVDYLFGVCGPKVPVNKLCMTGVCNGRVQMVYDSPIGRLSRPYQSHVIDSSLIGWRGGLVGCAWMSADVHPIGLYQCHGKLLKSDSPVALI